MDATDAGMVVNVVGGGANFGVNFSSVSGRHPFAKQAEEVLVDARAEIGAGVARRRCLFLVLQGPGALQAVVTVRRRRRLILHFSRHE